MTVDIMVDIETLGLTAGSVILSIGAVHFDRTTGAEKSSFYCVIDVESSADEGLTADPKTVAWWARQGQDAQRMAFGLADTPMLFGDAMEHFNGWCWARLSADVALDDDFRFWSQGSMDAIVIGHALIVAGVEAPWEFWQTRDTRSVYDAAGFDRDQIEFQGTKHCALDDARHQVRCLVAAINKMKGAEQ